MNYTNANSATEGQCYKHSQAGSMDPSAVCTCQPKEPPVVPALSDAGRISIAAADIRARLADLCSEVERTKYEIAGLEFALAALERQ